MAATSPPWIPCWPMYVRPAHFDLLCADRWTQSAASQAVLMPCSGHTPWDWSTCSHIVAFSPEGIVQAVAVVVDMHTKMYEACKGRCNHHADVDGLQRFDVAAESWGSHVRTGRLCSSTTMPGSEHHLRWKPEDRGQRVANSPHYSSVVSEAWPESRLHMTSM